jgi:hypothetical protein
MAEQAKHWNFQRLVTYRETGWIEAETIEQAKELLKDANFTLTNDGDVMDFEVADDIDDVEVESVSEMEDES